MGLKDNAIIAEDIARVAWDLRMTYARIKDLADRYADTGVATAVNALAADTDILPGTEMSKATLQEAAQALTQFQKFMDGQVVTQDDYGAMINRLSHYKE